tara:strand:- start:6759 stop:7127 length:369 start_codon:yes stop_codon:yes gene_type:complete
MIKQSSTSERRISNRAVVSWKFRGYNKEISLSGVITNTSSSGCLASFSCLVNENDKLALRIAAQTDNGLKEINVSAVVKRVITKGQQCFAGLQFRNLLDVDRRFIDNFVGEWQNAENAIRES